MRLVAVAFLVCGFLAPYALAQTAQGSKGSPVHDASNPVCKQWVEADTQDKAKGGKGLFPIGCTVIVPNCPPGSPPDKGTCTLGGFCVGYTACGKKVEGKPGGVPGSPGTAPSGAGSSPTPAVQDGGAPTPKIDLPRMQVDAGINGIGAGFEEPQSGTGYGSNGGQGGVSGGWASELLGFLSGLAGLFGSAPAASSGEHGSAMTSPQPVTYTPVYVNTPPPAKPPTEKRIDAPRFIVGNTFGAVPAELFPFLNFNFSPVPSPSLAELTLDSIASEALSTDLERPAYAAPVVFTPPVQNPSSAQEPMQPRARIPEFETVRTSEPLRLIPPFGTFRPIFSNVTFPEPPSLLNMAFNSLPPVSSIVSVPNLSFDLARSGMAVASVISEFLAADRGPLAGADSSVVNDVNADSSFFFGGLETSLWAELASAAASVWHSFLTLLD